MKKLIYLLLTITLVTATNSAGLSQINKKPVNQTKIAAKKQTAVAKKTAAAKSVAIKDTAKVIETGYMWPVKGKPAGEGTVCKPQGYIEKEFNFGNLFITAPESSTIVSPSDGVISNISIMYLGSLQYSTSFHFDSSKSFDENISAARKACESDKSPGIKSKYLSVSIGIKTEKAKVYINGLSGDYKFKTGQKIAKGQEIGKMAYSYYKFEQPTICLSISINSVSSDPMTPFGLKTTFVYPKEQKPVTFLTKAQAKEDFNILIECIKEEYPSLYDVVTPEELDIFVKKTNYRLDTLKKDVPYSDISSIVNNTIRLVHDSHIWRFNNGGNDKNRNITLQPQIWVGIFNDGMYCNMTTKAYEKYFGKKILSVNGYSNIDTIRSIITKELDQYDAKVQSVPNYSLATTGFGKLVDPKDFRMDITFADGEKVGAPGIDVSKIKGSPFQQMNKWMQFMRINRYPKSNYQLKELNDSTAYIGLSSFELSENETDDVCNYIKKCEDNKIRNLIFDVRNNGGGHADVLLKIFGCLISKPLKLDGYDMMNKIDFETFKYSMNRSYDGAENGSSEFDGFKPRPGKNGVYSTSGDIGKNRIICPDSLIHYSGKLYVLANENSISAATLFAALTAKSKRGVVIGRETASAYHFMTAIKFSQILLPNSKIGVNLPLIKTVFDTEISERFPYGRGVLPDYEVPLTFDNFIGKENDAILDRALQLIQTGK